MGEFKKVFNEKKLNAPKAENFAAEESKIEGEVALKEELVSSPLPSGSPRKPKRSPSPKVDYEKLVPLVGAPRLGDKIAFQVDLKIFSILLIEKEKF